MVWLRTEVAHLLWLGDDDTLWHAVDLGTVGVAFDRGVIPHSEGELPPTPQALRGAQRSWVLVGKAHKRIEAPANGGTRRRARTREVSASEA